MRYSLERFNQASLIKAGLDEKDIFIIAWFSDFLFSGKMSSRIIDQKEYFWVQYQAIIDDLPILKINNKEVIARRFKKYEQSGILEKKLVKNSSGTYTMFRILPGYSNLLSPHSTLKSKGLDSGVDPKAPDSKVEPKDSTTNNSITRNSYTQDFLNWYNLYPKEFDNTKSSSFSWWKKKSKKEKDDIISATKNYKYVIERDKIKNNYIYAARNFIGRDSRYIDYLEIEKPKEKPKDWTRTINKLFDNKTYCKYIFKKYEKEIRAEWGTHDFSSEGNLTYKYLKEDIEKYGVNKEVIRYEVL